MHVRTRARTHTLALLSENAWLSLMRRSYYSNLPIPHPSDPLNMLGLICLFFLLSCKDDDLFGLHYRDLIVKNHGAQLNPLGYYLAI